MTNRKYTEFEKLCRTTLLSIQEATYTQGITCNKLLIELCNFYK